MAAGRVIMIVSVHPEAEMVVSARAWSWNGQTRETHIIYANSSCWKW